MSERFSILRPLKIGQQEWLVIEIMNFFSVGNANEYRRLLNKSIESGNTMPLSVNDFFDFMRNIKKHEEIEKYRQHVLNLVKKLEQSNLLYNAGNYPVFSMGGEKCYYCMKEFTKSQGKNSLWLGECLGLEYIQFHAKSFVVPVTGITDDGVEGIGTGTLINSNTILTCQHVLAEMNVDKTISIAGKEIEIANIKYHDKVDVGIIKLCEQVDLGFQMVFGDALVLDEILTMGFPPIPMARDAYLTSQKGEINAFVNNFDGVEHFIYSSITRPGNSGGPIFSKKGHVIGISARHLERESITANSIVPFFEGIPSCEIIKAIRSLELDIDIAFEDYQ